MDRIVKAFLAAGIPMQEGTLVRGKFTYKEITVGDRYSGGFVLEFNGIGEYTCYHIIPEPDDN